MNWPSSAGAARCATSRTFYTASRIICDTNDSMTAITRWVLAHKRLVVAGWIVLTLLGGRRPPVRRRRRSSRSSRSPARKAGTPTSRSRSSTRARAATPRRCCRSSRCPRARPRARRGATSQRSSSKMSAGASGRARHRLRLDRRQGVRLRDGRTVVRDRLPAARSDQPFGDNPKAEKKLRAALRGRDGRGRARAAVGLRRAPRPDRRLQRPGRAARGAARRPRRAARARVRVRLVPRVRADRDGDRLDPHDVPARLGADDGHRRLADRAVPRRADRARRGDRLRAARRRALARGARARARGRRGRRARDGDRRPRRRVQRHDRRDRPARAGRAAAAVPALGRLRRPAHPARQRRRRHHAAARRPQLVGPQAGLAARARTRTRRAARGRAGRTLVVRHRWVAALGARARCSSRC